MKRLAHKHFWWPGLDKDVAQLVTACDACRSVLNDTPKVPLQPWPVAELPWKRIHIDFAGPFLDVMWFIVVNAYSKWPEVIQMKVGKTTTMDVINALSEMFSRYGIAEEIVSDNGTQFTSEDFQQWCSQQGIRHIRSAPYQLQSNGQAERFVQNFKNAMLKSMGEGERKEDIRRRLLLFLQRYRITPHPSTDQAPAERFLKRELRTQWNLMYGDDLAPLEKARAKMKLHFDEHECTKAKDELTIGATFLARVYRGKDKWVQATIIQKKGNVMWLVKVAGSDRLWTRHSNQLCLIKKADKSGQQELAPLNNATEEMLHDVPDWTPDPVSNPASDPAGDTMPAPPPQSPAHAQPVEATPGDRAQAEGPTLPPRCSNRERRPPERYVP
uniref:RNA-directed DNA polymerase n=1 Tax=Plectus sambesii TaxID=2011161 RepID=A0A914UTX7_9BILA